MKHGNLKSFIMGVLVTVMVLGLALPAAASVGTKTAQLYYNNIKIRLNGTELTPKDATGKEVEPFVIGGTTYLPVRAIGEALGLNVGWDGKTSTVILGNDAEYNQPAAWLTDLDTISGTNLTKSFFSQGSVTTANTGEIFANATAAESTVVYALNGQYARFSGAYYLPKIAKDTYRITRLCVYADDALIYTSDELAKNVAPIHFDIDVRGANQLKIDVELKNSTGDWQHWVMWDAHESGKMFGALGNAALWTK